LSQYSIMQQVCHHSTRSCGGSIITVLNQQVYHHSIQSCGRSIITILITQSAGLSSQYSISNANGKCVHGSLWMHMCTTWQCVSRSIIIILNQPVYVHGTYACILPHDNVLIHYCMYIAMYGPSSQNCQCMENGPVNARRWSCSPIIKGK